MLLDRVEPWEMVSDDPAVLKDPFPPDDWLDSFTSDDLLRKKNFYGVKRALINSS